MATFWFLEASIVFSSQDDDAFLNLPGLSIVLGGTIAATLMSCPFHEFMRVFRAGANATLEERYDVAQDLEEIVQVSPYWFSQNLRRIQDRLDQIRNPYLRAGIQLVIDDTPMDDVSDLLNCGYGRDIRYRQISGSGTPGVGEATLEEFLSWAHHQLRPEG